MKDKNIERVAFEIIREYDQVLKDSARRTFVASESELPHSKKVIKNAFRVALLAVDDQEKKEQLKSAYISLANFVSDKEAMEFKKIPPDLFSFLDMAEDEKQEFLRERFKSGFLGDYETAIKITRKIAGEQRRLRKDMDEF
ncbi:MAG: hypothetical protein JSV17_12220 [Candidatus Aminicenantes bacterium]|nr:MAG: hypothetical protein JSV17_12220 [Candidatus Aminicenantes bacterium]